MHLGEEVLLFRPNHIISCESMAVAKIKPSSILRLIQIPALLLVAWVIQRYFKIKSFSEARHAHVSRPQITSRVGWHVAYSHWDT